MSGLRVIAGIAKGRRLKTRKTNNLRPATDYIKEALFNILAQRIENCLFLDLYAGSGSIGIEALSRGARRAVFVEKDPLTVALIRDNLTSTGFTNQAAVYLGDVLKVLRHLQKSDYKFDLVFVDPPFRKNLVTPTLEQLLQLDLLATNGLIVTRSFMGGEEANAGVDPIRTKTYGDNVLRFYTAHRD